MGWGGAATVAVGAYLVYCGVDPLVKAWNHHGSSVMTVGADTSGEHLEDVTESQYKRHLYGTAGVLMAVGGIIVTAAVYGIAHSRRERIRIEKMPPAPPMTEEEFQATKAEILEMLGETPTSSSPSSSSSASPQQA